MNRLIIIGNGFDRAHGLPTSYSHFINDFWRNIKENYKKKEIKKIVFINDMYYRFLHFNPINNYLDFIKNLMDYCKEYNYQFDDSLQEAYIKINYNTPIFKFENNFFKLLNQRNSIQNWVDIENEYYKQLKKISKIENSNRNYLISKKDSNINLSIEDYRKEKVEKLNEEFDFVKKMLKKYLINKVNKVYDLERDSSIDNKWVSIYNILKPISIFNNEHKILDEFTSEVDREEIRNIFSTEDGEKKPTTQTFLLSFNYTKTIEKYVKVMRDSDLNVEYNYIHGEIGDLNNPIVFGFGDEMDEHYKFIERIDDNEYLKNFKSFKYLQNSNYNELLKYINSERFQVLILGHSCGLSDRTLLNTIFEHKNCRSIKVYYHERDEYDNYTEIIQNVSRHFNDKKVMREKIVNKALCRPFPQLQLPKKEL